MVDLFNPAVNFPAPQVEGHKVPWHGLEPATFFRDKAYFLPMIQSHMAELVKAKGNDAGLDYLKYLSGHCQYWLEFNDFKGILEHENNQK